MVNKAGWACFAGILSLVTVPVTAQAKWSWTGCPDVTSADFRKINLVARAADAAKTAGVTVIDPTLSEPLRVEIAKDGRIFFPERKGAIKVWKPGGTLVTVGTLNVYSGTNRNGSQSEMGVQGFVLDPGFATNNHVYIHYAPAPSGNAAADSVWKISRFTLIGDVLDKASEKVLFEQKAQRRDCCHTGGAMQFDGAGNLFITMGNNTTNPGNPSAADAYVKESNPDADDQGHAANTNDLRGKILRIHPTPDGKYTVPAGNLFPAGTAKTRPEIWSMGHRNAYSVFVDIYRNWVTWGDIGPDEGAETEEINLFTSPGFAGWPYFAGAVGNPKYQYRMGKNAAAPVNNSPNNTGLNALPPARGAIIGYRQSAAITGPIYYYDGANPSTVKFPPHFNRKWLISDFNQGYLDIGTVDEKGETIQNRARFMSGFSMPLEYEFGPDGALYVVEYGGPYFGASAGTKLTKLEYTGTCRPAEPTPPPLSIAVRPGARRTGKVVLSGIDLGLQREVTLPAEAKGLRVFDVRGRIVWEYAVPGGNALETGLSVLLPAELGQGLYRVGFLY